MKKKLLKQKKFKINWLIESYKRKCSIANKKICKIKKVQKVKNEK